MRFDKYKHITAAAAATVHLWFFADLDLQLLWIPYKMVRNLVSVCQCRELTPHRSHRNTAINRFF